MKSSRQGYKAVTRNPFFMAKEGFLQSVRQPQSRDGAPPPQAFESGGPCRWYFSNRMRPSGSRPGRLGGGPADETGNANANFVEIILGESGWDGTLAEWRHSRFGGNSEPCCLWSNEETTGGASLVQRERGDRAGDGLLQSALSPRSCTPPSGQFVDILVADDFTLDHVDDFLCNVRGMISKTFQVARNEQ